MLDSDSDESDSDSEEVCIETIQPNLSMKKLV